MEMIKNLRTNLAFLAQTQSPLKVRGPEDNEYNFNFIFITKVFALYM